MGFQPRVPLLASTQPPILTNRPPKGDRSEGFYIKISFFIDFSGFRANFIENHIILFGNLVVIRQD